MHFRPLPLLTLLAFPALALLLGLGVWQLDRAEWKEQQIEAYQSRQSEAPMPLADIACAEAEPYGRRVRPVEPASGEGLQLSGRDRSGQLGWRLFQMAPAPACLESGYILVETGFRPLSGEAQPLSAETGLIYTRPQRAGQFTPDPNPAGREFYAFDRAAMADALGLAPGELYDQAWLSADDGELPAVLSEVPPARHIGYAVTWFGFAFALLVVYFAFHAARGRLAFTRRKD